MSASSPSAVISGRVIKLGDNVDTDLIYPGKYLTLVKPEEWGAHALEGLDPEFPKKIRPGDVVVAGQNFGCGSSRSQAVSCLKQAGVGAVVAGSFARIFFRNSINQGLPVIECPEASAALGQDDPVAVRFTEGVIESRGREFRFSPLPEFLMEIILAGGLVPHTRELLARRKGSRG